MPEPRKPGQRIMQEEFQRREDEIRRAHEMLDALGAVGHRGIGSIRERLSTLLTDYATGRRQMPTSRMICEAKYSSRD